MSSMLQSAAHRAEVNWSPWSDGQQEVLSMMVNRWVKPLDAGRGPTRSMWMWLNRRVGVEWVSVCVAEVP
jgi:hypothetical protein